jgi:hypothetical protein
MYEIYVSAYPVPEESYSRQLDDKVRMEEKPYGYSDEPYFEVKGFEMEDMSKKPKKYNK